MKEKNRKELASKGRRGSKDTVKRRGVRGPRDEHSNRRGKLRVQKSSGQNSLPIEGTND